MNKISYLLLSMAAMAGFVQAAGTPLMIDFTQTGQTTQVQSGYQAYYGTNLSPTSFTEQSFTAFNTTVKLLPTWPNYTTDTRAMRLISRDETATGTSNGNQVNYPTTGSDFSLIRDWIGADHRGNGSPMVFTITGLPAGKYNWKSYHNDLNNIVDSKFTVTIADAAGTVTSAEQQATVTGTPASVKTYTTTFESNGVTPIVITWTGTSTQTTSYVSMIVVNGFEITEALTGGAAFAPSPASSAIVDLDVAPLSQLSWNNTTAEPNIVSITKYDLIFGEVPGTDPNFTVTNIKKANITNPMTLTSQGLNLDYDTTYYWRIDTYVLMDSVEAAGGAANKTKVVSSPVWSFTTLPADLTPVVKANSTDGIVDKNILTSLDLLPATIDGFINYQDATNDIASVKWEVTSKQVATAVKQMQERTDATQFAAVGTLIASTGATVDGNFLKDWIGSDTREQGDPMQLTLKGLPAGTYTWKSYHHDIDNQVGTFDMFVYVNKSLVNTVADQTQTAGAAATAIKTATTSITVASSSDVVDLVFNLDANNGIIWNSFFVMNGFELSNGTSNMVVDFGVSGAHSTVANCLFYDAQNEVDSTFIEQSYSAFGTTVSLLPTWGSLLGTGASIVDTKNDHTSVAQSARFTTNEPGVYVITFSATDGVDPVALTGSDTMLIDVRANACLAAQGASTWPGFNTYDYNSDCKIDILDFANFAKVWLEDKSATAAVQN